MTINFLSSSIAILIAGWFGDIFSLAVTFKITATASLLAIPFILILSKNNKSKIFNSNK